MCGRYVQGFSWSDIAAFYDLDGAPLNIEPNYNVAPTQQVYALTHGEKGNELSKMRWGLIPSWWKKPAKEAPATFNARAETVAEKPFFRAAFKRKRCIIPASGYYEWKATSDGKQPYYISSKDGSVLSFAGLWDEWKDVESGSEIRSCTVIVTSANNTLIPLHDRMPVILSETSIKPWIHCEAGAELLKSAPENFLHYWPVAKRVNSPRINDFGMLDRQEP